MVEWLRRCDLMVTNDTGPMHVAAALGKPVVGLFGPTEPRRTGPYGQLEAACRTSTALRAMPQVPLRVVATDGMSHRDLARDRFRRGPARVAENTVNAG